MTIFGGRPGRGGTRDTAAETTRSAADRTMTLKDLKVGDTAHIVDYLQESEAVRKIEAMGLRRGKKITIMQKLGRGIVVKTGNSRIVITADVAVGIEVR
jgi:ferrous iron transport protein A